MNINTQFFTLPIEISDARMDIILGILNIINPNTNILKLSFKKNKIISPAGYSVFMCLLDAACEQNVKVEITDIDQNNKVHKKIDSLVTKMTKTKLFLNIDEMNLVCNDRINWSRVSSIAPELIKMSEDYFLDTLGEESLWIVQLILNELMQNVVDHSTSERYFIYCGLSGHDFEFGVCDRGVSIPAKLETKYSEKSDHRYIEKSLELEVGTRRSRMGGMGLYYLFENIKDYKGKIVIISRFGQVRRHFNARSVISKVTKYPLRGTWCFARIPLEKK